MTTFFQLSLYATLWIVSGLALRILFNNRIQHQMNLIVEAAKNGTFKRPLRFRSFPQTTGKT